MEGKGIAGPAYGIRIGEKSAKLTVLREEAAGRSCVRSVRGVVGAETSVGAEAALVIDELG